MRIILDAMGGDHAPDAVIAGAVKASAAFDAELVLVGRGADILEALKRQDVDTLPKGMEIANAEDVVDMHDEPATVYKRRRDSSMVVGLRMLAEDQGDAMISAGSTGALLSTATLIVKRIPGVKRAALAPVIPTATGQCLLIDCGASAEPRAEYLAQYGCMGDIFARECMGIAKPRVALLNIGTEDSKGDSLRQEAYRLLRELGEAGVICFTGNIEARDVPLGGADVVVSDGFSGNVLLKGIEGTASFMSGQLKQIFTRNAVTKLSALACKTGIRELKELMDYRRVGGTPLLGLRKPVIKAHGSSDELAFYNAVRQAVEAAQAGLAKTIQENIGKMSLPKEQAHAE